RAERLGQAFCTRLTPEADGAAARAAFGRALADGRSPRMIHPLHTRDGGLRTVAWRGKSLASLGGFAVALAVVGDDITDLQEVQRQALPYERRGANGPNCPRPAPPRRTPPPAQPAPPRARRGRVPG